MRLSRLLPALSILLASALPAAPAVASTFSDVPSSHPDAIYIEQLVTIGAVAGQNGMYRPGDTLTRAEMCKIAILSSKTALSSLTGTPTFNDVPATHSLFTYVETAARLGIVSGFGNNIFMPDAPVTRGQASKILANTMKLAPNTTGGPHFTDVWQDHSFYVPVETLYNAGAVNGLAGTTFGVDTPITRAEMARFTAKTYTFVYGGTTVVTTATTGLTTDQTSACVKDRMVTKRDETNNIIVQAYTSGEKAAANNALGVVIKVTDLKGRPVPQMNLRMDVTEGNSGSITNPSEIGRSGVYLGSYASSSTYGTITAPKVTLLVSEESNYTRATGYEDVKAFPSVFLSFELLQSGQVGSVNKICWDLTRSEMTIDANTTNGQLDDYIVVIGLVEDGNGVGITSGVNMSLYITGDSSTTLSSSNYAGGAYAYRFQPSNTYANNVSVTMKRTNYLMLQFVTTYRVFSSEQLKTVTTYIPRV